MWVMLFLCLGCSVSSSSLSDQLVLLHQRLQEAFPEPLTWTKGGIHSCASSLSQGLAQSGGRDRDF